MSDILQIENGVLISCTDKSATSVTIPDGVTQIGENAFKDCTSLSSVLIPESVTEIGRFAFHNCAALSSLSIPTSVTK
ncbi:leucine-rich repeat domain-containing protein, partial [Treponema saccharophilum]|uniref:leucine-rich repeat domain-containing protein n=1 Tax=Treponema saccharophilum TaxID=165 RepID=UPI00386509D2